MPRKKQNIGENLQTWVIKDVDEETRRNVRVYAAVHDLTMAQALKELVQAALEAKMRPSGNTQRPVGVSTAGRRNTPQFVKIGDSEQDAPLEVIGPEELYALLDKQEE